MTDLSIRDVITRITQGTMRIPAFQREFVWESEDVAFLMDSIYKGYPFGSIQIWRTKEKLNTERALGPFPLMDLKEEYPVDYVIDGQQRITSIFGVFQTDISLPNSAQNPFKIYFDIGADTNKQETQFVYLEDCDVDTTKHFPLNVIFDSIGYRKATKDLTSEQIIIIDELQAKFKEARIPVQTLETDDKEIVAIVFERINRKGVPLDTMQLLCAWTWSDDFALREEFEKLAEELRPFGFEDVGSNNNLILRMCSAILTHTGVTDALMNLNGATVRERFDEITNGVKGAIDFLRKELKIEKLANLPTETVLVPLSTFFSAQGNTQVKYASNQRTEIVKWLWKVFFTQRYGAATTRNINRDIEEMVSIKNNGAGNLANFAVNISADHFLKTNFNARTINSKTFILMLAQYQPKSFITGASIDLANVLKEYNRNEYHHICPRAFLRDNNNSPYSDNPLANICIISRADNNQIGAISPSEYRNKMPNDISEICQSSLIDPKIFETDNYNEFVETRASILYSEAKSLMGI